MNSLELATLYRSPRQHSADRIAGRVQIARELAQDIEAHTERFLDFLRSAEIRASGAYVDLSDDVNRVDDTLQDIIGRLMKVTP